GETKSPVVHGNHGLRLQVQERLQRIFRTGVDVAIVRRVIGTDWQQCQFGMQTTADLTEAIELCCIAGVIQRVLPRAHNIAAESTVKIPQHAGAPWLRGHLRNTQLAWTELLPPFKCVNCTGSQPPDDVTDV